jgi:multiple RNA-binding domain-containing protein 1
LDLLDDGELPRAVKSPNAARNDKNTLPIDDGEQHGGDERVAQEEKLDDHDENEDVEASDQDPKLALIRKTSRLFVRNLCYSASKENISDLFSPYGQLQEVSSRVFHILP